VSAPPMEPVRRELSAVISAAYCQFMDLCRHIENCSRRIEGDRFRSGGTEMKLFHRQWHQSSTGGRRITASGCSIDRGAYCHAVANANRSDLGLESSEEISGPPGISREPGQVCRWCCSRPILWPALGSWS